jgi:hypothetical protein
MRPLSCLAFWLLVACGHSKPAENVNAPTSVQLAAPSRAVHLRAAFDRDPSTYIGRFLPDGIKPEDIDENAATPTGCSKFIKPRIVDAMQDVDETIYVSKQSEASLGLAPIAALSAGEQSQRAVRVRYRTVRKLQSDIDADGLMSCCRADPTQCTGTIIGEFIMGSGSILQRDETQSRIGVDGQEPKGLMAHASSSSGQGWRSANSFDDVYFAFLTTATPVRLAASPSLSASDCSWCENLPKRLDGKYFCGLSADASSEAQARELALRDARVQAVRFVGESIVAQSTRRQSLQRGLLEDERFVASASEGLARHVKDEVWCKAETVPSPEGLMYRTKVLAFIANGDVADAASHLEPLLENSAAPQ